MPPPSHPLTSLPARVYEREYDHVAKDRRMTGPTSAQLPLESLHFRERATMESVFNLTADASCANLIASARASSCGEKENGLRRRLRTTDAFVTFPQLAAHKARDLNRTVGYTVKSRHTSFHRTVSCGMNGVPTKTPAPLFSQQTTNRREGFRGLGSVAQSRSGVTVEKHSLGRSKKGYSQTKRKREHRGG